MLDSDSTTVGSTSSPTGRARPPSTATVNERASSPGPATSKRIAVPSAQPACLPTTNGIALWTRSERQGRGAVPVPAGSVQGAAGVLLVHPAVEDPHLHERRPGHLADGAPADRGPLVVAQGLQLGQAGLRHLHELVADGRAGERPARRDPALVAGREVVLDMVAERAVPRRLRLAHDGALDPDEVGELVLDVPARALGGQAPFGRRQLGGDVGQAAPRLGQRRRGLQPPLPPITTLTCTVVVHGTDPTPGACLRPPGLVPVAVTIPPFS